MDRAVLLLTRPRDAAQAFAYRIAAVGLPDVKVLIAPLMEIAQRPGPIDYATATGVIFTSRNGVAAARANGPSDRLPCHCVGQATAEQARAGGWPVVTVAETAQALVTELQGRPLGPLLHICGAERRGNIAARLTQSGVQTTEQIAYDQRLLPLPTDAASSLGGTLPIIAPLFSPRSARHFAHVHAGTAPLWLPVISQAVAETLDSLPNRAIRIADRPDLDAMLDATIVLIKQATRVESGTADD